MLRGIDPTPASTGPLLQQRTPILEDLETRQATLTDFFSVAPGGFGLKLNPTNESLGHALPQVIVTGCQTLPTAERTPDNRGNAYMAPGGLADDRLERPGGFALPSFDCDHVGLKPPTDTPGCFPSEPQTPQGKTLRFPQLEESRPGGVARREPAR